MQAAKQIARRAIGLLFGQILYSHVYIYRSRPSDPPPGPAVESETLPNGRTHFAIREDGRLLCECYFISGSAYRDRFPRPLRESEAVLVRLLTHPEARGRGLAPHLIAQASAAMTARGHDRLFAMIWHNNEPSKRAFRKAGWGLHARHLTLRCSSRRRIDLVWPKMTRGRTGRN